MAQTILIVEDEPASLRVLSYYLYQEGYYVVQARNGLEAMELMGQFRIDIVLSDLKMPGMDGVALVRHLVSKCPNTPVLVMSGYAADDVKALSELRVPCLSKPLALEQLKSEIQAVLRFSGEPLARESVALMQSRIANEGY